MHDLIMIVVHLFLWKKKIAKLKGLYTPSVTQPNSPFCVTGRNTKKNNKMPHRKANWKYQKKRGKASGHP
jgi:hypothetical protein